MTRVPIGQFSKMTRLSIKALRLYADRALLVPADIDSSTGYRYYDLEQAQRAEAIRVLRSVDMPLDDIRSILDAPDAATAQQRLLLHRQRLAERLSAQERMLAYLESIIERREIIMTYEVELIDVGARHVAAVRIRTDLKRIAEDISKGFATLMQGLHAGKAAPAGAPSIVYLEIIDQETEGDIEICVPVAESFGGQGDVYARELEGGKMASTLHRGPYEEVTRAYHTLSAWIAGNNFEIAGPPRETYLNDPREVPPEELLTRVEFPVCS